MNTGIDKSGLQPKPRAWRQATAGVLGLTMASFMFIGSASAGTQQADSAEMSAGIEKMQCRSALYRILPGAFNYCLASNRWASGHYYSGLENMERAAKYGNKRAQLFLGVAYFNGDHVTANRPLGLAWLALAAERGEKMAEQFLASAHADATLGERARAQQLLTEMWPDYADYVAVTRANTMYKRGIDSLGRHAMYGDGVCIDGITGTPLNDSFGGVQQTAGCPSFTSVKRKLDTMYAATVWGWTGSGTVTVHPLTPVSAPPPPRSDLKQPRRNIMRLPVKE